MAGEITDQEALGAEAHASNITYRTQFRTALNPTTPTPPGWKVEGWKVKQEPVFSVHALNHKGTKPRGVCFHCGARDHFVAQCPRKASGLAPVVNAAEDRDGEEDQDEQEAVQYVRTQYPPRPQQVKKPFGTAGPAKTPYRGGFKPNRGTMATRGRKFNRRIAFIYEDENGQTIHEEIPDPDAEGVQEPAGRVEGVDECTAGINTLHLDEQQEYDYSEGDFIPGAFLGM